MNAPSLSLNFFNEITSIHSDTPAFLEFFRIMYQRFLLEADLPVTAEYALFTGVENPWGRPVLVLDGETWELDRDGVVEAYAYDGVLNSILAKVRSHYLIHAAALSWQGSGIALVADAGQGKTTLSLELVGRGFRFLSDELAAIKRQSNRLDAFPRRLRLRPQTLDLLNIRDKSEGASLVFGKYLVDIEDIFPGSLTQAADFRYLFFLENAATSVSGMEIVSEGDLEVYVDRIDDNLLSSLRGIPGVTRVVPEAKPGFPLIHIQTRQRGQAIMAIEELCAEQRVLVLEISKRPLKAPSFHPEASIEPIPHSQAVLGLLRQFLPGHHSALIKQDYGGSSTRLFIELARSLEHTECYRLNMGPLRQTADLMCSLICG
jgi:hypothetical protein